MKIVVFEKMENITGFDDVTVGGDVGKGLRTVLLHPRSGGGFGGGIGRNDDVFALVDFGFEVIVVVDVVNLHQFWLRHFLKWLK